VAQFVSSGNGSYWVKYIRVALGFYLIFLTLLFETLRRIFF